jgi:hypothetical protein
MEPVRQVPKARGFRRDRRYVVLTPRIILAHVGAKVQARVLARKAFVSSGPDHILRLQPSREKPGGRSRALDTRSADAARSVAIVFSGTPRRERSTASVAAHARRRTTLDGVARAE